MWKAEAAKPGAVAGYMTPPRVMAVRSGRGGSALAGYAEPGARVLLIAPDGGRRSVTADRKGLWTIVVPPSSDLRLFGVAMTVAGRSVQAEGFLALTPEGRLAQLRPGASAWVLAPASRRPLILSLDFDHDGAAMVSGVGTVGAEIGLRLDRTAAGGSMIDRSGRYSFALSRLVGPGDHELEISGEGGEDVVAFAGARAEPFEGLFRAVRLQTAWRIDWMTPGGGIQSTLLFDKPAAAR